MVIDREQLMAVGWRFEAQQMEQDGVIAISADEIADAILALPLKVTDEMVERAANRIWPLDDLSSDAARDELRRDVRCALEVALNGG